MEIFGWVLVAIILGIPVLGIVFYNRLVGLNNQVKNAWRQIDVQLKRRHDLIPNLVEVVKDYMSYEQETLQKVIQARNQAVSAHSPEEAIAAEGMLGGAVRALSAVSMSANAYSFQAKMKQKTVVAAMPVTACGSTMRRNACRRV